jgi:hypothetical protein
MLDVGLIGLPSSGTFQLMIQSTVWHLIGSTVAHKEEGSHGSVHSSKERPSHRECCRELPRMPLQVRRFAKQLWLWWRLQLRLSD